MKSRICAAIVCFLTMGCHENPGANRYEILNVKYEEAQIGGEDFGEKQKLTLCKLDTSTGRVWRYYSRTIVTPVGVRCSEGWEEMTNFVITITNANYGRIKEFEGLLKATN